MKKIFVLGMALLMVVGFAGVSFAYGPGNGITDSPHNFSSKGWNTGGEICQVCHTPHNAQATYSPLWNHEVTAATFTVYSNPDTLDAAVGQPGGVSKLCLSCHDGTVALDNFGGKTTGSATMGSDDLLGTNLSDDHPISFVYDLTLANTDGGLYDPTTTSSGLGGTGTIDTDMLFSTKLECASCHDVHNGSGSAQKLLVKSNAASALCLTCHNK